MTHHRTRTPLVHGSIPATLGAIGGLVALARFFGWECWAILSVFPGRQSMSFATGVCFVFLGGAMFTTNRANGRGQLACRLAAAFILLAMGWQLAGHAFGFKAGLEALAIPIPNPADNPGPSVGTMFAFIGLSLWGILRGTRWAAGDHFTACGVMIIGAFGLLGHILGVPELAFGGDGSVPMAIHTSALFMLAGWGVYTIADKRDPLNNAKRVGVTLLILVAAALAMVTTQRLMPERANNADSTNTAMPRNRP